MKKLLTVMALISCSVSVGDVGLETFVNVSTEAHIDKKNGFALEYPYLWQPGSSPYVDSTFFVGASYDLPSFTVILGDVPITEQSQETQLEDIEAKSKEMIARFLSRFNVKDVDEAIEYQRTVDFNGKAAIETKIKFRSPLGERIPLQAIALITVHDDTVYFLCGVDLYSEVAMGKELQGIFESFRLLEGEER